MPTELSFDFSYLYPDQPDGITLPTALSFGGKVVHTYAKVDCGAECCIFSHEVGRRLGLDIESGIPKLMGSLTGTLDTFGHEVTIQTLNVAFVSVVYFAKYTGVSRNLLGRNGWLRQLRVAIIDYDNMLYYGKYEP
jgi:hypothetical protein